MLFVHSWMTSLLTLRVLSKSVPLIILSVFQIKGKNVGYLAQCQPDYQQECACTKTEINIRVLKSSWIQLEYSIMHQNCIFK